MSAAEHVRSTEAEVRAAILEDALPGAYPTGGLGSRIHARFAELGGVELELPSRDEGRRRPLGEAIEDHLSSGAELFDAQPPTARRS